MPEIFVAYRRADTAEISRMVFQSLIRLLPPDKVFIDIDQIPLGVDFVRFLEERIREARLVIAIIGDNWLGVDRKSGKRRIDDPLDFLRLELEIALKHSLAILTVLV